MSDGRIIIDTKIDTSGAEAGCSNLKSKVAKLAHEYKKAGMDSSEAWKKAWSEIERSSSNGSNALINNIEKTHSKGSLILAGAVGAAATALTAIGGFALKTGVDFESAFAGVKKTVNASSQQLDLLKTGIIEMSNKMPEASTEIAGVAEAAGQLGIKTENILGFTKTMVMLGDSTNMSSEQAATALARLANITGMPQTQFNRLGSTIVALGNNMATTESEIVSMSLRLAGAGHQVGMSEAQIMSFSAALSSVGISAEEGGSAFSRVMVQMQLATETGGKSLENFAQVAGMSAGQFKQEFKENASQAILHFIQGLNNMKAQGKSAIKVLDDMGIKDVRLRDTLLRASGASGEFTKALNIGNEAWKQNTALTNEASQRYETASSKLKILKNNLVSLGISIYSKFEKPFKNALDVAIKNLGVLQARLQSNSISASLDNIASGFGKLIEVISSLTSTILPPLITALGWILSHGSSLTATILGVVAAIKSFAVINKTVNTITKMKKAWDEAKLAMALFEMGSKSVSLSEAALTGTLTMQETIVGLLTGKIKLATVAQRIWNTTIKANPIGFVISAIIGLITVFTTLWATSERFRNFWIGLWNSIKSVTSKAISGIKNALSSLGVILLNVGHKISNVFRDLKDNIKNSVGPALISVGEKAKQIWDKFKDTIIQLVSKLSILGVAFNKAGQLAKQAWNGLLDILNKIKEKLAFLVPVINLIGNSFLKSFTTTRGLMLTLVGLISKIGLSFIGITGPIGLVASLLITLSTSFLKISGFSAEGISKTFNDLGNKISKVSEILANNIPKFIEAGENIITNLANGISNNLPKIFDIANKIIINLTNGITNAIPKIVGIATNIINSFANFIVTNLPKIISLGTQLLNNLIQGITNAIPKILGTVTQIITSFADIISNNLPIVINSGVKILNNLIQGIVNALPKIINVASKLMITFVEFLANSLPKVINIGTKILGNLTQGIVNALPNILTVALKVIQTLLGGILTALPKLLLVGVEIIGALIFGITQVIGKLLGVAIQIITTLVNSLIQALPQIIEAGIKILMALIQGIIQILPVLIQSALQIIMTLVQALITNLPTIIAAGIKLLMALIQGIIQILPQLIMCALKIIITLATAIITNLPKILSAGVQIVLALIKGIGSLLGQLLVLGAKLIVQLATGIASKIGLVISKATEIGSRFLSTIGNWFSQLPGRVWSWLVNTIGKISSWGSQMYSKATQTGSRFVNGVITWISQLPGRIWSHLCNAASRVVSWGSSLFSAGVNAAGRLVSAVVSTVSSIPGKMVSIGQNIVQGVWNGITGAGDWFAGKVSGFFSGIVDKAKSVLGIHSPSRVFAAQVGRWIPPGIGQGIKNAMPNLRSQLDSELISLSGEMKATVQSENASIGNGFYAKNSYSSVSKNITNNQGVTQNITFNNPVETPSETARRIQQVGRDLIFG